MPIFRLDEHSSNVMILNAAACSLQLRLLRPRNACDFLTAKQEIRVFKSSPWIGLACSPCASINCRHTLAIPFLTRSEQIQNTRGKSQGLTNKRLPINEIPCVTKQINRRVRNLLHPPPPPHRHTLSHNSLAILLLRQSLHALRSHNRPRGNDIARQPPRAKFHGCTMA